MPDVLSERQAISMAPFEWTLPRDRRLRVTDAPGVMGIVNVTPDSFSDGGVHYEAQVAIEAALKMEADGAVIVDVGGESTRPGAEPVTPEAEMQRVIAVIQGIRAQSDIAISIDTMKPRVAKAALDAGADIVNDVSGLRDPEMIRIVADYGVPAIVMHMRGEPRTMQTDISYDDVVNDIATALQQMVQQAVAGGVRREALIVDPGIGFGKTFEHNLEILAMCERFSAVAPVMIGASRKAFIGNLTGQPNGAARMAGSLAAVAAARRGGAALVRVHDVRETVDFLRVLAAIDEKGRA
jgi:dihydropteroate synthase